MSDEAKTPFDEALDATAPTRSVDQMIDQLPDEIAPGQIDEILGPVLDVISGTSKLAQEAYLKQLKSKTKLPLGALRVALKLRQGKIFRGEIEQVDDGLPLPSKLHHAGLVRALEQAQVERGEDLALEVGR